MKLFSLSKIYQLMQCLIAFILCLSIIACGGGTAGGGGTGIPTNPTNPTTPTINSPSLILDVLSGGTVSTHTMNAGASINAKVILKNAAGVVVPNTLVNFKLSDDSALVIMNPSSGNTITDANGIATITLKAIAPSPGGVFQVSASATVPGIVGTSSSTMTNTPLTSNPWPVSIGAANAVLGTASLDAATPNPLPANNATTIRVPVTSLGLPVSSLPASSFTASSTCALQTPSLASIDILGATNGVAVFNYKNLGCTSSPDIVSIGLIGSTSPSVISVPVASAASSELRYINATPSSALVVKGAGGFGRQESGTLMFKLLNTSGNGVVGSTVNFSLSTVAGGIALSANSGVTDSNGLVSVIVYAGKVPTPLSVLASTTDSVTGTKLSSVSSLLSISAGPPEQKSFSLSVKTRNIRGWDIDGNKTDVTARLSDFWGNSVSDGTVVSMIAEGANISNSSDSSGSCKTINGACTMVFTTQAFRPTDGRVSITAFSTGVESFEDNNGNGIFDSGENCSHLGAPYIDSNENGIRDTTEVLITNIAPSSDTIKLSTSCAVRNNTYVYEKQLVVLSGLFDPNKLMVFPGRPLNFSGCNDLDVNFTISDINYNPVPFGTSIAIQDSKNLTAGTVYPASVPDTSNLGGTHHQITFSPDQDLCKLPPSGKMGSFKLVVTTDGHGIAVPFSIELK